MSDLLIGLGALAALLLGVFGFGFGKIQKRKGKQQERQEAKNADRDRADNIRRRARDADGVHPDYEDRGYRD